MIRGHCKEAILSGDCIRICDKSGCKLCVTVWHTLAIPSNDDTNISTAVVVSIIASVAVFCFCCCCFAFPVVVIVVAAAAAVHVAATTIRAKLLLVVRAPQPVLYNLFIRYSRLI